MEEPRGELALGRLGRVVLAELHGERVVTAEPERVFFSWNRALPPQEVHRAVHRLGPGDEAVGAVLAPHLALLREAPARDARHRERVCLCTQVCGASWPPFFKVDYKYFPDRSRRRNIPRDGLQPTRHGSIGEGRRVGRAYRDGRDQRGRTAVQAHRSQRPGDQGVGPREQVPRSQVIPGLLRRRGGDAAAGRVPRQPAAAVDDGGDQQRVQHPRHRGSVLRRAQGGRGSVVRALPRGARGRGWRQGGRRLARVPQVHRARVTAAEGVGRGD